MKFLIIQATGDEMGILDERFAAVPVTDKLVSTLQTLRDAALQAATNIVATTATLTVSDGGAYWLSSDMLEMLLPLTYDAAEEEVRVVSKDEYATLDDFHAAYMAACDSTGYCHNPAYSELHCYASVRNQIAEFRWSFMDKHSDIEMHSFYVTLKDVQDA